MNKKTKSKSLMFFCTLIVFLGLIIIQFASKRSYKHLSSVKPILKTKAKRSLELGSILTTKKNIKKEKSILLNDPAISKNWGLSVTASNKAWNITRGSKHVVVAVIDTGIDSNHADLKNNLWINKGEYGLDSKGRPKQSNGIDDDKNGYVDDIHGWNFVKNNNRLTDNHGHGTHIAGIIGAEADNNIGLAGVSPKVSLMILKYYDPKAPGLNNLNNTVRAINYAVKMNANIINYSGGGLSKSPTEFAAIKKAQQKGILFVAAAGNEMSNSDLNGYYPADYKLDNIISVTAVNKGQQADGKGGSILDSSNYGKISVDIAAPGNDIYSTLPGNKYGTMTGTSQATAFVSGVASLLLANNSSLPANMIKKQITQTGDYYNKFLNKTKYSRVLNSWKALTTISNNQTASGAVTTRKSKGFTIEDNNSTSTINGFGNALLSHIKVNQASKNKVASKDEENNF